jgi:4a-hydroxytetrahydrobiopterin dehydratase
MTNDLKKKKCVPCEGGVKPLHGEAIQTYMRELGGNRNLIGDKMIGKDFPCINFMHGMNLVNKVAALAEEEGHHPDVCISYTNVRIELFTHAIGGLSENDFILAAKIDDILEKRS